MNKQAVLNVHPRAVAMRDHSWWYINAAPLAAEQVYLGQGKTAAQAWANARQRLA